MTKLYEKVSLGDFFRFTASNNHCVEVSVFTQFAEYFLLLLTRNIKKPYVRYTTILQYSQLIIYILMYGVPKE